jgi:hypothetical protein
MAEDDQELEQADTLAVQGEPKSSASVLKALQSAEKAFREWQDICDEIDDVYSRRDRQFNAVSRTSPVSWYDAELDLFWASYEILKPAVYARTPKPVVTTQFKDRNPVKSKTAELLERTAVSSFDRSDIDSVMCQIRDDLIFTNRGVMWITYESEDGQKVCFEHLDRKDFRHEPARKWEEVGWVARRAWMTRKDMRKRFRKDSGDAYQQANFTIKREEEENGASDGSRKASVWEVWHKVENKVYWVSEGVDVLLDVDKPHLSLKGFFPCPKPAFGTLGRRTLVPTPDYERYATHFAKINTLTSRIYLLLESVKMKGLIPSGGDIADAIEELIRSDDDQILIPVPSAQLNGDMQSFVAWMPLEQIATTIQGLISARGQLIDDFYQLSGISDIMRGATEAEETLGAQQLKSQYGSIRVKQKIDELQRIAKDSIRIASEIISEKFSQDTLFDMSQMEIPTKADIDKQIKGVEKAAEQELKALSEKAEEQAEQAQSDPQQAQAFQQQFQQAQQQILQKYAPMLNEAKNLVPIEDVMKLLRDDKSRGFAFEIEDGSTVLADEAQEKASRNEFMAAFSNASTALMPLVQTGPEGAKLAGAMLKFQLSPYRTGRELDSMIDEWIDAMSNMPQQQADDGSAELAAAQKALAEAEGVKAQAAMANVQAKAAQAQADNERKMAELQVKAQESAAKLQAENDKLQLQLADLQSKDSKTQAEIDKLRADTAKILASIGLDVRKQELAEYTAANAQQQAQVDTALKVSGEGRAERGEERADRQQEVSEQQTERQMSFNERQAMEPAE